MASEARHSIGKERGSAHLDRKQSEEDTKASVVYNLRMAGWTFQQIADELGYYDAGGPWKLVTNRLKRIGKEAQELGKEYFALEMDRLSGLVRANWRQAIGYEDEDGKVHAPSPKHAGVVLRCIKQEAKLLGLEAPAQLEVRQEISVVGIVAQLTGLSDLALNELERTSRVALEGNPDSQALAGSSEGESPVR